MDALLAAKLALVLLPIIGLLIVFERLDAFRLVSTRDVLTYLLGGAVLAAGSYVGNSHVRDGLPIGFTDYSRYVAPVIEETLKAALIVFLFARNRIGFKLDAAIIGFAIGAGFSMFENAYFLWLFPDANIGVWVVRGFGTATMHGGAAALMAVISHEFVETHAQLCARRFNPLAFLPGLMVAIVVHSAFNHLPGDPLLAMVAAMVLIPITLLVVFSRGGTVAHHWLEDDHEAHAKLLAEIRAGRFADTEDGRAVAQTAARFPPDIAADVGAWIELQLMLVLRAEELLLARERGEHAVAGPAEAEQFARLDVLGAEIGHAARHAIRPHLRFSRDDLYELHLLRQAAHAHART